MSVPRPGARQDSPIGGYEPRHWRGDQQPATGGLIIFSRNIVTLCRQTIYAAINPALLTSVA